MPQQLPLFPSSDAALSATFPTTRYQGSKRKLAGWIWSHLEALAFDSVLDVFGGTAVVSHLFKTVGKQVTYNDLLLFNQQIGLALIENDRTTLTAADMELILQPHAALQYPDLIAQNFSEIYFTDAENRWLDRVVTNIDQLIDNPYKQALARFALFQACIIKRPYNLFHRANLYMRTAEVQRSFGNKKTWDTPFETHFRQFVAEANAAVFDNGRRHQALCCDALDTPTGADLVYLDPPYLNSKGIGVDYRDFYHFLEGLVGYSEWEAKIDYDSKHRRLLRLSSPWSKADTFMEAFEQLIVRHRESILVLSYRSDGYPTKAMLMDVLQRHKSSVQEAAQPQQYVLSNKKSQELLLVAK